MTDSKYDALEISFPVHTRAEEEQLERLRAKLIEVLYRDSEEKELVYLKKKGKIPFMEACVVCYLHNVPRAWRMVREVLAREGALEKTVVTQV